MEYTSSSFDTDSYSNSSSSFPTDYNLEGKVSTVNSEYVTQADQTAQSKEYQLAQGPSDEDREMYQNLNGLPFECGCCSGGHQQVWDR